MTIDLTAKIVAAYVERNNLAATEIGHLITIAHAALASTATSVSQSAGPQLPAVPVKKSVAPHAITCLECGSSHKMLKRHLTSSHGMTVEEYRLKWSLPSDYPMVSPDYSSHRSKLAVASGLGRKSSTPPSEEPADATVQSGHRYPASRWSRATD